jgi:hypothetical protein
MPATRTRAAPGFIPVRLIAFSHHSRSAAFFLRITALSLRGVTHNLPSRTNSPLQAFGNPLKSAALRSIFCGSQHQRGPGNSQAENNPALSIPLGPVPKANRSQALIAHRLVLATNSCSFFCPMPSSRSPPNNSLNLFVPCVTYRQARLRLYFQRVEHADPLDVHSRGGPNDQ